MEVTAVDVRAWIAEDLGAGDLTSEAVVPEGARARAVILLKERGVVCGLEPVRAVFEALDPEVAFEGIVADGVESQGEFVRLEGDARALLGGERLALNLLGRLSGIATLTRRYVDAVDGTGATILDTRKTTPGLRALEKEAVKAGGGVNHRFGLFDAILVKENHAAMAGGVGAATAKALAAADGLPVVVECATLGELREALEAGARRVLLDNMPPATLREAVAISGGRAELEASGGVSLETVRAIAESGVDYISVGALTHSAHALDISLLLDPL